MHCLFRSELLPVQKFLWAEWEILHLQFKFLLCFLQAPLVNLFTPNSANSKQFAKKKKKKSNFRFFYCLEVTTQPYAEVLLKRFHFNGNTTRFHPQIPKPA